VDKGYASGRLAGQDRKFAEGTAFRACIQPGKVHNARSGRFYTVLCLFPLALFPFKVVGRRKKAAAVSGAPAEQRLCVRGLAAGVYKRALTHGGRKAPFHRKYSRLQTAAAGYDRYNIGGEYLAGFYFKASGLSLPARGLHELPHLPGHIGFFNIVSPAHARSRSALWLHLLPQTLSAFVVLFTGYCAGAQEGLQRLHLALKKISVRRLFRFCNLFHITHTFQVLL
jgi:hypothetical protein